MKKMLWCSVVLCSLIAAAGCGNQPQVQTCPDGTLPYNGICDGGMPQGQVTGTVYPGAPGAVPRYGYGYGSSGYPGYGAPIGYGTYPPGGGGYPFYPHHWPNWYLYGYYY